MFRGLRWPLLPRRRGIARVCGAARTGGRTRSEGAPRSLSVEGFESCSTDADPRPKGRQWQGRADAAARVHGEIAQLKAPASLPEALTARREHPARHRDGPDHNPTGGPEVPSIQRLVQEVSEQTRAAARGFFEVWSNGDLERLDELLAADVEALRSLRGGSESLVLLGSTRAFAVARARAITRSRRIWQGVWDGKAEGAGERKRVAFDRLAADRRPRRSVVFPAPLGPRRASILPRSTARLTPASASVDPKRFATVSTSIIVCASSVQVERPAIKSFDRSMRAGSTRRQRGQQTLRLPHRVDAAKVVRARWKRAGEAAETIDRLGVVVCCRARPREWVGTQVGEVEPRDRAQKGRPGGRLESTRDVSVAGDGRVGDSQHRPALAPARAEPPVANDRDDRLRNGRRARGSKGGDRERREHTCLHSKHVTCSYATSLCRVRKEVSTRLLGGLELRRGESGASPISMPPSLTAFGSG
jgi:hypothetical protein